MRLKQRLKLAVKCILGKPLSQTVSKHEYHLFVDDSDRMKDMAILVTGGTGAIGSAICYELAAMGANVGMCGRNKDKLAASIASIEHGSPTIAKRIVPVEVDVTNEDQIESAIEHFFEANKKIDVLINNAGGQPGRVGQFSKHLFEKPIGQIDLILDTNLRSAILCSRVACRIMSDQGFGHIISMSSVIGLGGKAGYTDYAASKAGLVGFSKALALEMAEYNVRVNCISPGSVNQVPFDSGSEPSYSKLNPLHRSGYTKEVSDTVVFLILNEFINGQNIIVDGGRSLGLYGDSSSPKA